MHFNSDYIFIPVSMSFCFGIIYFFLANKKRKSSADNIQRMIKELENKIINA